MNRPTKPAERLPSALEVATFAVTLLEDNPLFNAGRGAVFTRDGTNELEASVMVSRGFAKRGVGVMGLRRVKNPILLARAVLEHGDADLGVGKSSGTGREQEEKGKLGLNVPSAQGHTQIFGAAAEVLARRYGLEMVEPEYFFTQTRWDEHMRALERETAGKGMGTWSADEYLPQGTVGAIALDDEGVVCCATSTGGMTNKLTGRVGDTPVVGAGFWAEEWIAEGDPSGGVAQNRSYQDGIWEKVLVYCRLPGPVLTLSEDLRDLMANCLPTPYRYTPVLYNGSGSRTALTTRSIAVSGTGNGDSFLRTAAARTVGSIARFAVVPSAVALTKVAGPSGELQKSAGDRWGRTGEGEGGMIGIECAVARSEDGRLIETRTEILQDFNCGGMFRAWIGDDGDAHVRIWRDDAIPVAQESWKAN